MIEQTEQTVHIAIGEIAGSALQEVAELVVVDDDNLLLGPSSPDLTRHRTLRARYWGGSPSTALDTELSRTPGPPVCVALPPTPGGLLSLCRICALAIERNRDVSVIDLDSEATGARFRGVDPAPAAYLDEAIILQNGPLTARWSKLQTAFAATLWRLWCRRSPVAFSRFCASGSALHPQIADLGRYHAGVFPRATAEGLLLSRVDELVLRQLSREWITPGEMFVHAAEAAPELDAWLSHLGDLYLVSRLLAWSSHTRGRVVERRRPHPARPSEMMGWAFRWHEGGEKILSALPGLEVAPKVEVGGAVAYDPDRPWVCRVDAAAEPYVSQGRRPEA
jgi:hypothetical protein